MGYSHNFTVITLFIDNDSIYQKLLYKLQQNFFRVSGVTYLVKALNKDGVSHEKLMCSIV